VLALGRGIPLVQGPPDEELLNAGQVRNFGDYELLEEIARGGMGVVYRARQLSLGREVAVKMILAGALATTEAVRRFRNEAAAAAQLDHPHIVSVYEIGEHEMQHYFSMRLVLGRQNIATWARALTLAPAERARRIAAMMAKVARAVAFAHEHGVLHRDLKPSNILVDEKGEPQVVDFGIARPLGVDSDFTLTGQMVGTPRYMAPEQVRGENRTLTPAADTYSLGAILYELLADRKIFDGADMLTLLRQVTGQPPAPLAIGERDLENIVLRCVEKSPDARYASAAEFADDLERWLRREPVKARSARWARRHPALAALTALAVIASATIAFVTLRPAPDRAPLPQETPAAAAAARRALEWLHSHNGPRGYVVIQGADGKRASFLTGKPLPPGDYTLTELSFDYWPSPAKYPPISAVEFRLHTATLHHLRKCYLSYLGLAPEDFAFLAQNPDLYELRIATLGSDAILAHAASLKKLRILRVADKFASGDKFTGRNLAALASLPVLDIVALSMTHIDDAVVAVLAERCPRLRILELAETRITDSALRSLARHRALEELHIGDNPALTDASLAGLGKIPSLKVLSIKGPSNFTTTALAAFQQAHPGCKIAR
jgi:hypothetical protein